MTASTTRAALTSTRSGRSAPNLATAGADPMGKLIYAPIASLDGYIEDEQGRFEWAAPDDEVLAFVNELERPVVTHLYGRRMYETMVYWETADTSSDQPALVREWAEIWRDRDPPTEARLTLGHHDRGRRAGRPGDGGRTGRRGPSPARADPRRRGQAGPAARRPDPARAGRRAPLPTQRRRSPPLPHNPLSAAAISIKPLSPPNPV
jgi:hypothetical protein